MAPKKKLGELLVEGGLINEDQLAAALKESRSKRIRLGEAVSTLQFATETDIANTLSLQIGVPFIHLQETPVDPSAIEIIAEKMARKHTIMPVTIEGRELHLAMVDPLSFEAFEDVRFASGLSIKSFIATKSDILWAIDQHYHLSSSLTDILKKVEEERPIEVVGDSKNGPVDKGEIDDLRKRSEAAPIIRMVNQILADAVDQGASDIHVEPTKHGLLIRDRVDGMLRETQELPKWVQGAIVSRIKIMAKLDIAEKRLPQDGRIAIKVGTKALDLRVSTMPGAFGEIVVLRILDSSNAMVPLESLGFGADEFKKMRDIIEKPQGIVLITGPTGSGKTTTLYGILNRIKDISINVTTIEDPIEYELPGINQVATQEKIGLTFATCLRAMLRQDPDVVMVGEMRDPETAQIAVQAALTGHLVLSTIHTNNTAATVTRLRDIGVKSFLIGSTIVGIIAQRLVRTICSKCKTPVDPTENDIARMGPSLIREGFQLYKGKGCDKCGGTGYKGRRGVYEILPFTPTIRELVSADAPEVEIRQAAITTGMQTLAAAAWNLIRDGATTIDEIFSCVEMGDEEGAVCPGCSAHLSPGFSYCPSCSYPVMPVCPACKKNTSETWKHCPWCRADLPTGVHVAGTVQPPPSRQK